MYRYSEISKKRLETTHPLLYELFTRAIKYVDLTILCGYRPPEKQFEYFKRGREEVDGGWKIIDRGKVITYKDGYKKKSRHNYNPSKAVDVAPYPISYNSKDLYRFKEAAEIIKREWEKMKEEKPIKYELKWGGDYKKFKDYVHWELI